MIREDRITLCIGIHRLRMGVSVHFHHNSAGRTAEVDEVAVKRHLPAEPEACCLPPSQLLPEGHLGRRHALP